MPASVKILLERFQLFRVPSLPPLLLAELAASSQEKVKQGAIVHMLEIDIFLYAKVLGSFNHKPGQDLYLLKDLLEGIGEESVEALISQAAMQNTFKELDPAKLNFFKMLWRQSYISRLIAGKLAKALNLENIAQAEFAAQFLNLGELVLEDLFTEQYRLVHETVSSEARQMQEERESLGFSHAEIGSELLHQWGLNSSICDAVHYHQEALEQVLDASSLVKLCWLTNLMSTRLATGRAVFDAGERLLGLDKELLIDIHTSAIEQLQKKSEEMNLYFTGEFRLPLQRRISEEINSVDQAQLNELNQQVRDISRFNAVRSRFGKLAGSDNKAKLGGALGDTLNLLFGFHSGIVFYPDSDETKLLVWISSLAEKRVLDLEIKCEFNRSEIADCYLTGKGKVSNNRERNMTVVDRQILSLLGEATMVCDPIVADGKVVAVLVLGIQQNQSSAYCKQGKIRKLLKAEILSCLESVEMEQSVTSDIWSKPSVNTVYERRISDTIHEVNNPLSIIKNYLHLLTLKQGGTLFIEEINVIKSEIDRVSSLLANLKNNVNVTEDEVDEVDVNLIIKKQTNLIAASISSNQAINFSFELAPDLSLISFKENAFIQIMTNLLKNAVEAMSGAGNISIKTCGNIFLNGRHYVQVIVSDDGPGISLDAMDNLFVPGHSTKGGGHSGSGLTIVKNLLESMGGQISCQSDENGTIFSMLFLRKMQLQKQNSGRRPVGQLVNETFD